jgi:hypothetical protein
MKDKSNNSNQDEIEKIIDSQSRENLSEWMMRSFDNIVLDKSDLDGKSCLAKLCFDDERTVSVQLKYLFESLDINRQQKFNDAITLATYKWTPAYGASIIQDLAFLSAYTRATGAIGHLIKFIQEGWLIKLGEEYQETFSIILAVLTGFAPSNDIKFLLENLWEDQVLHPTYTAQIFMGLCKCEPSKYYKYLPRFLDIHKKYPGLFKMNFLIPRFAQIVPLSSRNDTFRLLDLDSQVTLDKLFDVYSKQSVVEGTSDIFDIYKAIEQIEGTRNLLREIIDESFIKQNKPIDNNNEVIQTVLRSVCSISKSQMTALFLFSKNGDLYLNSLQGTDLNGEPIVHQDWFGSEIYPVFNNNEIDGNNFVIKAAIPTSSGFGKTTHWLSEGDLPIESKKRYISLLGVFESAIAVPLNGAHKTFGILVVINKVYSETLKPVINCVFSRSESKWLSQSMAPFVARRISDLRKNKQKSIITFLEDLLQKSSAEDPRNIETACQSIVDRLISDNTAFNVCILRKKVGDKLTVIASSPKNDCKLVSWDKRSNEPIEEDDNDKRIFENQEPEFIEISNDNIYKFTPNEKWVIHNNFKSFARFPLIARGKVIGTLSFYVSYDYNFHASCKKFLSTIATLMALFLVGGEEYEIMMLIHDELEKKKEDYGLHDSGVERYRKEDPLVKIGKMLEKVLAVKETNSIFLGAEGNANITSND